LLKTNILIDDHLVYQEVRSGSNLRHEDTLQEEKLSGLHPLL